MQTYTTSRRKAVLLPHTAPNTYYDHMLAGQRNPTDDTYCSKDPLSWTFLHVRSRKMSTQRVPCTVIEPVAAQLYFCAPSHCPRPGITMCCSRKEKSDVQREQGKHDCSELKEEQPKTFLLSVMALVPCKPKDPS
eukprot:4793851-Ditylum_brightwellii.AAC.1